MSLSLLVLTWSHHTGFGTHSKQVSKLARPTSETETESQVQPRCFKMSLQRHAHVNTQALNRWQPNIRTYSCSIYAPRGPSEHSEFCPFQCGVDAAPRCYFWVTRQSSCSVTVTRSCTALPHACLHCYPPSMSSQLSGAWGAWDEVWIMCEHCASPHAGVFLFMPFCRPHGPMQKSKPCVAHATCHSRLSLKSFICSYPCTDTRRGGLLVQGTPQGQQHAAQSPNG